MTSRADQLFLELCLVRLRYSEEEIERVANLGSVVEEAGIRNLITALREIRAVIADSAPTKIKAKQGRAGAFRKKVIAKNPRDKSDTEPFLNLARSLMKK